jgi:putative transcriptional regulator
MNNLKLRYKRKERKLTQAEIAQEAGITRSYYSMIERGVFSPSVKCAKKIARILQMSWKEIYPDEYEFRERDREPRNDGLIG